MTRNTTTHSALYLVATLKTSPGAEADLVAAMRTLVPQSKAEPGCIQYDLHVDIADPTVLIVYEIWRDQQALDSHVGSPHFQAFLATATPLLSDALDVRVLSKVE
jgi:quinol monooxygenase YgiN